MQQSDNINAAAHRSRGYAIDIDPLLHFALEFTIRQLGLDKTPVMNETKFRQLSADFYVAPQLRFADFAAVRALGIRTVINNRPDGEASDQLPACEAANAASAEGLAYAEVPMISGMLTQEAIGAMSNAMAEQPGPHLAYCRSGTRSTHLWALVMAEQTPPAQLIEAAAAAGYDISSIAPLLERIYQYPRSYLSSFSV